MANEQERIINLGEASGISDDDYVMIDHATEGARKYPAKSLMGKVAEKTITQNGTYTASNDSVDGYSKIKVNVYAGEPTLVDKTITENGAYDPADDNADGYLGVTVNVSGGGGESIDGVYFDGTNALQLWTPYYCEDYELEIAFNLPSYQYNKSIIGNTANGYYFDLTMYNDNWTINGGNSNQIIYTPQSFKGDHIVILNRLADRAVIFDNENIGTMGTNNFSNSIPILIGYRPQTGSPEFFLKHLKITSHATSEVLANYEAGFRYLKDGYNIPCLLNTVDGTYIDLNTGRQSGNNDGHIMLCQHTNDNYA